MMINNIGGAVWSWKYSFSFTVSFVSHQKSYVLDAIFTVSPFHHATFFAMYPRQGFITLEFKDNLPQTVAVDPLSHEIPI